MPGIHGTRPSCQRFLTSLPLLCAPTFTPSPPLVPQRFMASSPLVPQLLSCRPPGVCARSLTFQLALQLETIAFSPDVESTPKPPPPPRCRASAYTPGSHAEAANSLETPLTTNMADYSECGTGRAVTHDGAGASQDRAGCGLRISRERARTFDNKPFVLRPRLEDFSIGDAADDANGNAWWGGALERTPGGRREGRRPNEGGKGALGRVDASSKVGHSRGRNMSTSPAAPYRRLGGDAGPRQSVPPTAVDIPARTFGNGDMVMVANLLAHPESLLKVSRGRGGALLQ